MLTIRLNKNNLVNGSSVFIACDATETVESNASCSSKVKLEDVPDLSFVDVRFFFFLILNIYVFFLMIIYI